MVVEGVSRASDIQRVADAWGGSYLLWGALLSAVGLGIGALGVFAAWWRRSPVTGREALRRARAARRAR